MENLENLKNKIENIKEHLLYYKWVYIIAIIILLLLSGMGLYEYYRPCVYGHHELMWQTTWSYNSNGSAVPNGGYFTEVFICDCRTARDSLK